MGIRRLPETESAPLPRGVRAVHELNADDVLHISVSDNLTAEEAHGEVRRIQRLVARERRRRLVAVPVVLGAAGVRAAREHPTAAIGVAAGSAAVTVVGAVFVPMAFRSPDPGLHHRRDVRPPVATSSPHPGGGRAPVKVSPVRTHPRGKRSPTVVPVSGRSTPPAGSVETPIVGRTPRVPTPTVRRVTHKPGRVPLPTDVPKLPPVAGVSPTRPGLRLPAVSLRLGLGIGPVGLGAEVSSHPGSTGLLPTVAATVRRRPR